MGSQQAAQGSGGGIGFFGLLTIAFIVLKLCSVITWSWLWVLAPIWLPITIILGIIVVGLAIWFMVLGIACLLAWLTSRRK